MKRTILAPVLTGMTLTLIAHMAMADGRDGPRAPGAWMERIDTNNDGQITRDEGQAAFIARFARVDTDGDGAVSRAELVKRAQARAAERAADRFERLDTDGDGEISQAELSGVRVAHMFDMLDANDDDILSAEELDAARAMRGKGSGGH